MNKFKFVVLLSLLFVGFISKAQEDQPILDLFAQEGLVNLKNLDMEFFAPIRAPKFGALQADQNTAAGILNNFDHSFYKVETNALFEKMDSSNIDSVLALMETGRFNDINMFIDPLYMDSMETVRTFFDINKRVVGTLQKYELIEKDILSIESSRQRYAVITYNSAFAKARGILELYFRISKTNKLGLAKMIFTPYSNQGNIFLTALAQKDIQLVSHSDFKSLEERFSPEYVHRIGKRKERLENQLLKYKVSNKLLTYRLFIRIDKIYVVAVFVTDVPNKAISLRYVIEDKNFAIDQISIVDQDNTPAWQPRLSHRYGQY